MKSKGAEVERIAGPWIVCNDGRNNEEPVYHVSPTRIMYERGYEYLTCCGRHMEFPGRPHDIGRIESHAHLANLYRLCARCGKPEVWNEALRAERQRDLEFRNRMALEQAERDTKYVWSEVGASIEKMVEQACAEASEAGEVIGLIVPPVGEQYEELPAFDPLDLYHELTERDE